jgi:hypothetical protein
MHRSFLPLVWWTLRDASFIFTVLLRCGRVELGTVGCIRALGTFEGEDSCLARGSVAQKMHVRLLVLLLQPQPP